MTLYKLALTNRTPFGTMTHGDCKNNLLVAAVAQSVERRIGSAEVTGPIPVSSFQKPLILLGLRDFAKSNPIN